MGLRVDDTSMSHNAVEQLCNLGHPASMTFWYLAKLALKRV